MKLLGLTGGEPDVGVRVRAERQYGFEPGPDADPLEPPNRPWLLVEDPALVGVLCNVVRHKDHLRPGNQRVRNVPQLVQHLPAPVNLQLPLLTYDLRDFLVTLDHRVSFVPGLLSPPHPPLDALQIQARLANRTPERRSQNGPQPSWVQAILCRALHITSHCTLSRPESDSNPNPQEILYLNFKVTVDRDRNSGQRFRGPPRGFGRWFRL